MKPLLTPKLILSERLKWFLRGFSSKETSKSSNMAKSNRAGQNSVYFKQMRGFDVFKMFVLVFIGS